MALVYICSECEANFARYLLPTHQLNDSREWWCHCCDSQCQVRCREVKSSEQFIQYLFIKLRSREVKIGQLLDEIQYFMEEIQILKNHIKYMPGGEGALEAMKDFTERSNSYEIKKEL